MFVFVHPTHGHGHGPVSPPPPPEVMGGWVGGCDARLGACIEPGIQFLQDRMVSCPHEVVLVAFECFGAKPGGHYGRLAHPFAHFRRSKVFSHLHGPVALAGTHEAWLLKSGTVTFHPCATVVCRCNVRMLAYAKDAHFFLG